MQLVYTTQFEVTTLHVDCFGRGKLSSLLRFSQDAAEEHCLLLGTDWDSMAKKNLFWAVIRQRIEITRLPRTGEVVTVKTWPMPTTRVAYPRAAAGYDAQGNELFRILSLWVIMDMQSRVMLRPDKSGIDVPGTVLGSELKSPVGLAAREHTRQDTRTVCFSDLDVNGHMNNTRYLDWLYDLLSASYHREHPVKTCTICYMNEAREGQKLQLNFSQEDVFRLDGSVAQTDVNTGHTRIFSAEVTFDECSVN